MFICFVRLKSGVVYFRLVSLTATVRFDTKLMAPVMDAQKIEIHQKVSDILSKCAGEETGGANWNLKGRMGERINKILWGGGGTYAIFYSSAGGWGHSQKLFAFSENNGFSCKIQVHIKNLYGGTLLKLARQSKLNIFQII